MLLTTSPSAISLTPAPALPDFHNGWPAADSARDDSLAADNPALTWFTSPGVQILSSDQIGNVQHAASSCIARSSQPATQVNESAEQFVEGCADATQVSFQRVLPGPDDSPKISHQYSAAPTNVAAPLLSVGAAVQRSRTRNSPRRRAKFIAAPPTHPLLLAGAPLTCVVQLVEVRDQAQPLFSLGVLEKAAKLAGITLRLETCPAEDGASWLSLDDIGRIPVSRIGGLVLIGYRMLEPGHILLGCSSVHSALIDTGAQVCLFSKFSRLLAGPSSAYCGPPLCGADNAFVECQSAANFVLHFDLTGVLPCLPRHVAVVTAVPVAVPLVDGFGGMLVYTALQDAFIEESKSSSVLAPRIAASCAVPRSCILVSASLTLSYSGRSRVRPQVWKTLRCRRLASPRSLMCSKLPRALPFATKSCCVPYHTPVSLRAWISSVLLWSISMGTSRLQ